MLHREQYQPPGNEFKGFKTLEEAQEYLDAKGSMPRQDAPSSSAAHQPQPAKRSASEAGLPTTIAANTKKPSSALASFSSCVQPGDLYKLVRRHVGVRAQY